MIFQDMTTDEMWQRASEARLAAKALQRKLQMVSDHDERKQIARQMNDLFNQASQLRNEAKLRYDYAASIEREYINMGAEDF